MVGAYCQPHELLKDIEVLVRATGRDQAGDRVGAMRKLELGESLS